MQVQKHKCMSVPERDNIINSEHWGEKPFSLVSLSVRRGLFVFSVLPFDAEFILHTRWEGGSSTGLETISLPICLRPGTAAPWEKNTGLVWRQESGLEIARRQGKGHMERSQPSHPFTVSGSMWKRFSPARSPPQASPLERRVETGKTCPSERGGMKRSFRGGV